MNNLSIITCVSGRNEITRRFLDETIANCAEPHELVVVANGNTKEENKELRRWLNDLGGWETPLFELETPVGPSKAFNYGIDLHSTGDVIAMLHNDLMVVEKGWDLRLLEFMENTPNVGIVGFAGAKQLAAPDIYRVPYVLTQLGRAYVYTSLVDWQPHGDHLVEPTKVAVLDGLALCCKREVWEDVEGFDENMIHHMYDNDLSLRALYLGYDNYAFPVQCDHISGQTANYERYAGWLQDEHGKTDGDVHKDSHEYFYDKWSPQSNEGEYLLPVRVE